MRTRMWREIFGRKYLTNPKAAVSTTLCLVTLTADWVLGNSGISIRTPKCSEGHLGQLVWLKY